MAVYRFVTPDGDRFTLDLAGEPQGGDFITRGEVMYRVEGRFWRQAEVPLASQFEGHHHTRLQHVLEVGVRLVATVEGPLDS
jgi:hypothetical protein